MAAVDLIGLRAVRQRDREEIMPEQRKPETRSFALPSGVGFGAYLWHHARSGETAHQQDWKERAKIGRSRAYIADSPLT